MVKINLTLTLQEIADLRYLVSVAVWVRSEQISNEKFSVFTLHPNAVDSTLLPPTTIENDMLNVGRAMKDFEKGRETWSSLSLLLKGTEEEKSGPSWHEP